MTPDGILAFGFGAIFVVAFIFLTAWADGAFKHKPECPCGKCYARRMKEAFEQAEYAKQQREIARAVEELRSSR